jgi:hypothetical protein
MDGDATYDRPSVPTGKRRDVNICERQKLEWLGAILNA